MWSATPPTTYASEVIFPRSTGVPSMLTPPGLTSAFRIAICTMSRCRAAVIRVVSAFQNSTSKGAGLRPCT
ncbi:hypothetical protein [Mycobacterium seoulense]|uniref:hypothetical protein n=1 Tax=Mycobacterium seoulense TaxID=386911 RepID=UPI001E2E66E3|nr:hypothetical protein [Mycobacterium seoulense]